MKNLLFPVWNAILSRAALASRLVDPRRDIEAECGHPKELFIQDYLKAFQRGDIAARVVTVWPEESWSQIPLVYETEETEETPFEEAWHHLTEEVPVMATLLRADILSGIGRFGIILIGVDDGKDLREPAELDQRLGRKLLYLRPFDESVVQINSFVRDPRHPRYGLPESYTIHFLEDPIAAGSGTTFNQSIHWTRVIHLCDNRTNSEVFGEPRLKKVMNRILDLQKIAGGAGEMYWKGGFPGLSIEAPDAADTDEINLTELREQVDAYMNGLQRYLATIGVTAKSLAVEIADPSPHVETQLKLIAASIGIPWRVFVGSESAQLASQQDARTWMRRVRRRQEDYLSPYIIRPFVHRLIDMGILPAPSQLRIHWPDIEAPGERDRAEIANRMADALSKYINSGADVVIPPLQFLTSILGMTQKEAEMILKEATGRILSEEHEKPTQT